MKDERPNVNLVTGDRQTQSLQEYEQALRTLYKQGWPTATSETRDAALKRKFEDGVASPELSQYLLHHRKLNFEETVEQARLYTSIVEGTKGKKSVRFIARQMTMLTDKLSSSTTYGSWKRSWTSWNVAGHVVSPRKKLSPDSVQRHVVLVLLLGIERVRNNPHGVVSPHVALTRLRVE